MRHHGFKSSFWQSSFRSRFHGFHRSAGPGGSRAPLAAGAMLAASALLAAGCNAPVAPSFELSFEGAGITSCESSAAHDIRLMCESKVRVRILDPDGDRDLVPPVCQEISTLDYGTMEALSQLDVALHEMPLGPAMVQVEIWRSDWVNAADCSIIALPDPIEREPDTSPDGAQQPTPSAPQPAVVGRAWFEIGRDEHVSVPMTCPDLSQVNRFAAGCGLDVEISDLDRGILLRQAMQQQDPDHMDDGAPSDIPPSQLDLAALEVQYVLIEQTPDGGWEPGAREWMTLDLRDDGSAVWRAWPSIQFWQSFNRSRTVCIEVNESADDVTRAWPQVSCFQVGDEAPPRHRLQASMLPPEDLECLLGARGTGTVPSAGIVIGRVVEPNEQDSDAVHPAANVQVLATPADLPREPLPRLGPIGDGGDTNEPDLDQGVQYVSKEPEPPSPTTPACHVDDATATTPSGYFLSDASFPAHWQIETDEPVTTDAQDSDAGELQASSGHVPGSILVGGRLPNRVSIVRIQLQ
ncbi:MAG TPA: hypothetical protein VNM90_14945 [Haliangium sp.]|nr:hypothetical protein [Haliangium sp.]